MQFEVSFFKCSVNQCVFVDGSYRNSVAREASCLHRDDVGGNRDVASKIHEKIILLIHIYRIRISSFPYLIPNWNIEMGIDGTDVIDGQIDYVFSLFQPERTNLPQQQ